MSRISKVVDLGAKLLETVRIVATFSPDPTDDEDYQIAFENMQRALRAYDLYPADDSASVAPEPRASQAGDVSPLSAEPGRDRQGASDEKREYPLYGGVSIPGPADTEPDAHWHDLDNGRVSHAHDGGDSDHDHQKSGLGGMSYRATDDKGHARCPDCGARCDSDCCECDIAGGRCHRGKLVTPDAGDGFRVDRIGMLDVWMALGGDPLAFDDWIDEPRRTPADAWAQLIAAVGHNIKALERDTNPPAGALLDLASHGAGDDRAANDLAAIAYEQGREDERANIGKTFVYYRCDRCGRMAAPDEIEPGDDSGPPDVDCGCYMGPRWVRGTWRASRLSPSNSGDA